MSKNQFSRPLTKPIGFSQFPREITKPPRHWVEKVHNLVFYKAHEKGGHWAAHEVPDAFTADVLDFLAVLKDKSKL